MVSATRVTDIMFHSTNPEMMRKPILVCIRSICYGNIKTDTTNRIWAENVNLLILKAWRFQTELKHEALLWTKALCKEVCIVNTCISILYTLNYILRRLENYLISGIFVSPIT